MRGVATLVVSARDISRLRLLEDDPETAFEALFRRHYPSLHRLAWGSSAIVSAAEEVVQDVFVHIWTTRNRWRPSQVTRGRHLPSLPRSPARQRQTLEAFSRGHHMLAPEERAREGCHEHSAIVRRQALGRQHRERGILRRLSRRREHACLRA